MDWSFGNDYGIIGYMASDKTKNFWDEGESGWGNWGEVLSRAKNSGGKIAEKAKRSGKKVAEKAKAVGGTAGRAVARTASSVAGKGAEMASGATKSIKINVKKVGVRGREIKVTKGEVKGGVGVKGSVGMGRRGNVKVSTKVPKVTRKNAGRGVGASISGLQRQRNYSSVKKASTRAARAGAKNYQNLNNLNKSSKVRNEKLAKNLEGLKEVAGEAAVRSLNTFKSVANGARGEMAQTWNGVAEKETAGLRIRRVKWLRVIVLIAVAVIGIRLFVIQILQYDMWVAKAEEQHTMQNTIVADRGEIYMMDGDEPVAVVMNEAVWTVIVDPMIADEKKTAEVVDVVLGSEGVSGGGNGISGTVGGAMNTVGANGTGGGVAGGKKIAKWDEVFADKARRYYVVARNLSREQAQKIEEAELAGVVLQKGTERVYPEGELAARTLGFVNAEGEGQYGVEGDMNKELKGKNGLLKTVKDVQGVALSIGDDNIRVPAENGKNIVLTIDRNVQRQTEKILAGRMQASAAQYASAIIMNPKNGKILAMANLPGYNPTNYTEVEDATIFQNTALVDAFEPASVCKTFTFAAGIEEGVMTPDTTYYNEGYTVVDGWTINNAYKGMLGEITMQTALNYSLNTGSTQALRLLGGNPSTITQVGKDKLYDYYYNRFGLGQYTGIELYESPGIVVSSMDVDGTDARYANMTFGQGLNLTMAQVVSAFASVVNGGKYYTPTVIEGEMVNGELVRKPEAVAVRQTLSEGTSATMRQMLYGTRLGQRWQGIDREGYFVGGKTGTSQAIRDGAYVMDETLAAYVGFGGTGDGSQVPEYVIMVRIWSPGKKIEGEKDAMPIFNELSNYMINYLQVKPS